MGGAHKRRLIHQTFREDRAKILPGKPGFFRADRSPFTVDQGPSEAGPIGTKSSAQKMPEQKNLFGLIGAFWVKPPCLALAKTCLSVGAVLKSPFRARQPDPRWANPEFLLESWGSKGSHNTLKFLIFPKMES